MFTFLIAALWGALLTLILCAPYSYYPLFLALFAASVIIIFISRKYFKSFKIYFYPAAVICFTAAYTLCSYIIFKSPNYHTAVPKNQAANKKAVIFYCDGEMEKYTPYYANYFFENTPVFLKPIRAYKIKKIYKEININTKNSDLTKIAREVRNSLLNYKPYYFYIAFSGYVPDVNAAVNSALNDGCSDITIINYTCSPDIKSIISKKIDIDYLVSKGVKFKFTQSIYSTNLFIESMVSQIKNMPEVWDGIILIDDNNNTSNAVKSSLVNSGYREDTIVIDTNIDDAIEYLRQKNVKSILYVNLQNSGSGINSDVLTPKKFLKYNEEFKITGIKSWGYDKKLIKASIEEFLKTDEK